MRNSLLVLIMFLLVGRGVRRPQMIERSVTLAEARRGFDSGLQKFARAADSERQR